MDFLTISAGAGAVLTGWGIANLGIGIWRQFHKSVPKRQFWLMNGLWGFVNSIIGLYILRSVFFDTLSVSANLAYQSNQVNIIFINIFLDIAYVVAGYFLSRGDGRRKIFGWAIIIQGVFLFVFDLLLWNLLRLI